MQEEETKIFWKGGSARQTVINVRKPVPGGLHSPFACRAAASLGFLGLTCRMEQLFSSLLGTCKFSVLGDWKEK